MWHKRQYRQLSCAMMCGAALMFASPAYAYDSLIEGAKMCTQYFPIKEREQQIPVHLLAAISTIETGRYHKGLDMALPWPWTINVEGQGHYYNSKTEAIAHTQAYLNQGIRSIDVGCMQVNLKHHPRAFANLNEAFDPAKNVDYAARFLQTNYQELGSWVKAAASYHSRTPSRGNPYLQRVAKAWQTIVSKVQQAQARAGVTQAISQPQTASEVTAAPDYKVVDAQQSIAPQKPRNKISSTHGVKIINVENSAAQLTPTKPVTHAASVLVIQTPEPRQAHTATVEVEAVSASAQGNDNASNRVDNALQNAHTNEQKSHFIFAE